MITKLIIDVVIGVPSFVVGLLPSVTLPAFFNASGPGSISSYMGTFTGWIGLMGGWLPVEFVGWGFAIIATCVGVAIGVRILRIVASFLTAGGGSAG